MEKKCFGVAGMAGKVFWRCGSDKKSVLPFQEPREKCFGIGGMARIQRWAKEWALGCVNSPPAAGGSQEAGFTQPRAHSFAQPCICPNSMHWRVAYETAKLMG